MYRFILKRLLMLIPVLLGVSFIVYTILSFTPGDPVQMMLGDNYSEESYAAMQEELGLDDPFLVQYGRFIINAVHGDFGTSYSTGNPVAAEIAARLPNTILLSACAMLFAILIGIPLGVISATHQYSAVDNISMVGALFGVSMPNFWLGLMLIVIFAAGLGRRVPGHLPAGASGGYFGAGRAGSAAGGAGDSAGAGADDPAGPGLSGPAGKGADPEKVESGAGRHLCFADGGLCPLCNSGPGRGVPSGDLFGSAGHRI